MKNFLKIPKQFMLLNKKCHFINKFLKLFIIICLSLINKNIILKIPLFIHLKNELKYQKEKGNSFLSMERGYNRIFVIDGIVPEINKNAGYRCVFMYLILFKEIGLHITFLPDNFKKKEPYTTILQKKGIEVLYGDW